VISEHEGPSGFLPVHKPAGITSFDVIRELRRQLKIKKLGHSGVLDKPATGLLVVGANKATRLFELFHGFIKEYIADLWFGLNTTTDDLTGERVESYSGAAPQTPERLSELLAEYTGVLDQIPPAFSLTKVGGKELYRYALAGQTVEVAPKRVTVHSAELLAFEPGADPAAVLPPESKLAPALAGLPQLSRAQVRFTCSGGVYVRSLARDIGADLGCGGALGHLIRTRIGRFTLEQAYTFEQLAARLGDGARPEDLLLPLSAMAGEDQQLRLDPTQLGLVRTGRSIRRFRHHLPSAAQEPGAVVYGLDPASNLVAILAVHGTNESGLVELKPDKVLN
jgi:tRNA pseudouridine55 synthase